MNFGGSEMIRSIVDGLAVAIIVGTILFIIAHLKGDDGVKYEAGRMLGMVMWAGMVVILFSIFAAIFLADPTLFNVLFNIKTAIIGGK